MLKIIKFSKYFGNFVLLKLFIKKVKFRHSSRFSLRKALVSLHLENLFDIFLVRRMCTWDVRKFSDFRLYAGGDSSTNHHVRLNFLLQVGNDGLANESFRYTLDGHPLLADIWGKDIFKSGQFKDVKFRFELDAKELEFKPNSFTTRWMDIIEMLESGLLSAFNAGNDDDVSTDVRRALEQEKSADNKFGAALRWSIQAKDQHAVKIVLQALPRPASHLRKDARLCAEDTPTIVLETTAMKTTFTEDGPCTGPKPLLFARDPILAKRCLTESPELLHTGTEQNQHF